MSELIEYIFKVLNDVDLGILLWLQNNFQNIHLDGFMIFMSKIGDEGLVWILAGGLLLIHKKYRKIGLMVFVALLFSLIITNIGLKNIVARIRPYDFYQNIELLIDKQNDYSFPSGHATASFAAAWVLFQGKKYWGIVALVIAVLISFSRLYLFMHYTSDVLAGMVIGIFCGYMAIRSVEKMKE